ncbi:XRE family transcriptional regulator [Halobacillus fulvus]|nr:XRE family transcriptional regulator [Halobacillus fulvus]
MNNNDSKKDVLKKLGNNIQKFRLKKPLTQMELHLRTGLDRKFISEIEKGNVDPSFTTLLKLTKGLGISIDDLCGELDIIIPYDDEMKK